MTTPITVDNKATLAKHSFEVWAKPVKDFVGLACRGNARCVGLLMQFDRVVTLHVG